MKWYRRMFFKTFEWYREMNGPKSWPEGYAAANIGVLHGTNIAAMAFALGLPVSDSALPYGLARWLLVSFLAGMVPPVWCLRRAREIESEFSTEEEVVNPRGRLWMGAYAVASVAAFVAAVIFRAVHAPARVAG